MIARHATLVSMLGSTLITSCLYQVLELEDLCNPRSASYPCATGEACSAPDGVVTCGCGGTTTTGVAVCTEGLACIDGTTCNQLPTVRIEDGRGTINVPGNALVTLHGTFSDADVPSQTLTPTWTIRGNCKDMAPSEAGDTVTLRTGAFGSGDCELDLEVSDGYAKASTSMALVIANVGTYVDDAPGCLQAYDPSLADPQGTPAAPFCHLQTGLEVAQLLHAPKVFLSTAEQSDEGGLVIPGNVRVEGGFAASPTGWTASAGARTPLRVTTAPGVSFAGGGLATLAHLELYRDAPCSADCALVSVAGATVAIEDCLLGDTSGQLGVRSGANGSYRALHATATADAETVVRVSDSTLHGARTAGSPITVELDGRDGQLHVELLDSAIFADATSGSVIGVLAASLDSLQISRTSITIAPPTPDAGPLGFGLVDGAIASFDVYGCVTSQSVTSCNASQQVHVDSAIVTVRDVAGGYGISLLGSQSSSMQSTTIGVSATRRAVGVRTSDALGVWIEDPQIDVTVVGDGTSGRLGFGVWDGNVTWGANDDAVGVNGASRELDIIGGRIEATRDATYGAAELLAPVALSGTRDGSIIGTALGVASHATSGGGYGVGVAGVRLVSTENVLIKEAVIDVGGAAHGEWVMAISDGIPTTSALQAALGSRVLTIKNSLLQGSVAYPTTNTLLACLALLGSSNVDVRHNELACVPSGTARLWQVWTSRALEVEIADNTIRTMLLPGSSGAAVGVYDGAASLSIGGSELALWASSALDVDANEIWFSGDLQSTGLWLRGEADTRAVITNNAILTGESSVAVGIRLESAAALVLHDTVHAPGRGTSYGDYTIAVHLLNTAGLGVEIANNILSVNPLDPAIVDANQTTTPGLGFEALVSNVWSGSALHARTDTLWMPATFSATYTDDASILAYADSVGASVRVERNQQHDLQSPLLCAGDWRLAPGSVALGAADANYANQAGDDLEQDPRPLTSSGADTGADAGADELEWASGYGCTVTSP